MAGRNPLLDRDVGEQGAAELLLTSHHGMDGWPIFAGMAGFFSKLLKRCWQAPRAASKSAVRVIPSTTPLAEAGQKEASVASQITDESALEGEITTLR